MCQEFADIGRTHSTEGDLVVNQKIFSPNSLTKNLKLKFQNVKALSSSIFVTINYTNIPDWETFLEFVERKHFQIFISCCWHYQFVPYCRFQLKDFFTFQLKVMIPTTCTSVIEEGYLIEEGGLAKFRKRYKRGSFSYKRGVWQPKKATRGRSLKEEAGLRPSTFL